MLSLNVALDPPAANGNNAPITPPEMADSFISSILIYLKGSSTLAPLPN